MNPQSARALVGASLFPLVLGPIALSLDTNFTGPALAAAIVLIPATFARVRTRIAACILLALSLAVAFNGYPDYRKHQERFGTLW